jgi:2-methylcitrate dehydratase PrpD
MRTLSRQLAQYILRTQFSDLSKEVIDETKMCILDWIGSALPGTRHKLVEILMDVLRDSREECSLIGQEVKVSCLNAALINGAISYVVKLDQSSPLGSMIHPQPPMIPAALAIAEKEGLGGRDFLTAVLLGFDVQVRSAMAVNPSHMGERGFHTTGTCGTFGAVTAAGKLLKLNEKQMSSAFGIAGTQAAGLTISMETFSRSLHAGKAAFHGVLSAILAKEGFTGPEAIFEGEDGFCRSMSNTYDLSKLTDKLGRKYFISDQRFVRYVTCGAMHAAIDAVVELRNKHKIRADAIELIEARTFPITVELCGRISEPKTFSEAQFSLPFALAIAAIDGCVGLTQMTEDRLKDPEVVNLAKKVKGTADNELSKHGYTGASDLFQSARVNIRTKNGKEYYKEVDLHRGSPQNPFTKEELYEKFRSLASIILSKRQVNEIIDIVENLEHLGSVRELTNLMRPS